MSNRIVAALLRQFGPSGGSTPAAPAVPTLSFSDNADGTGAVATVAGSSPGSTNTLYVAGRGSGASFASSGSRTGDGVIAVALAVGLWWGYVRSSLNSQIVDSLVIGFQTTDAGDDCVLVRAAKAVATELAGHDFGLAFTPQRNWGDWEYPLADLDTLRVDVVPGLYATTELDTRGTSLWEPQVHVVIRKRFTAADQTAGQIDVTAIDELVSLLEAIHALLAKTLIGNDDEFAWKECVITLPCSQKMLRLHTQYLGIVRLTFSSSEDL